MSHKVTRRGFLRLGAAGLAGSVVAGCHRPRRWVDLEPYVRPPEEQLAGVAAWYASTCRQCPAGCGILVRTMNGRALKIEGNPEHPLNRGKLCARGQAGLQVLYHPDRLRGPVLQKPRGSREFVPLSWEQALNTLYAKLESAGNQVAIWGGLAMSGHLYDLFQRLATAIGAPSPVVFDLYSELSGYRVLRDAGRAVLGRDELPAYDLGHADVILSFGADFLGTGLSAVRYGAEFGAFRSQPLGKRGYLVQLEPRMSTTGAVADRWLPVRPGSEAMIAQALAYIIGDRAFGPTDRVDRARTLVDDVDLAQVAAVSGLSTQELEHLAYAFATVERPLAIPGGLLTGQDNAAEATAMVQALNVISGTAGQPGGLSASPGSPMSELVRPEACAFSEVQDLLGLMHSGQIRVLLVHGANPAYSAPDRLDFAAATQHVPFVVSFSPFVDETAVLADVVLPDRTYLESWGYQVVSPSFGAPLVSSQQPVVEPVFDARSTGDVLLTMARGISPAAEALPWSDEVAFLKQVIGRLPRGAHDGSSSELRWARFLQHGGWWPVAKPETPLQIPSPTKAIHITPSELGSGGPDYPYFLYLYMSDLLSDGRGANQSWLQGSPDPMTTVTWQTWVELHPETAQKIGVRDGDVVRVSSPQGELEAAVYVYPAIRPDTVAIPIGQGHTDYGRYAQNRGANPVQLVGMRTDVTGSNWAWATVWVKIVPTGRRLALARFENQIGVNEGFVNRAFPG